MKELRSKEKEIYRYIKDFAIEHGYLPSIREIGNGVGLKDIQHKGYINREWGSTRYSVKGLRYIEEKGDD